MPPVKKLELIPQRIKSALKNALQEAGFGNIVEITDELNGWLKSEDIPLTIGKSAVGNYAQVLRDQQQAFEITEDLMSEVGIDDEAAMHRGLMHMIAAQAVRLMVSTRENGGELDSKDLVNLGKMLKELMGSAGIREKILADEQARIEKQERERVAGQAETVSKKMGLNKEQAADLRRQLLGVAA